MLLFSETVELNTLVKRFLRRSVEIVFSPAYGKNTDNIIAFGDSENGSYLVADAVVISDVAFIPAALISELNDRQKHILDRRGIILYCKASVTVCIDLS